MNGQFRLFACVLSLCYLRRGLVLPSEGKKTCWPAAICPLITTGRAAGHQRLTFGHKKMLKLVKNSSSMKMRQFFGGRQWPPEGQRIAPESERRDIRAGDAQMEFKSSKVENSAASPPGGTCAHPSPSDDQKWAGR